MPGVDPTRYASRQSTQPATCVVGANESTAVPTNGLHFVSVWRPASTGFTSLKFDISDDGVTWYRVKDKANADYVLTLDASSGAQYLDSLIPFAGASFIRAVPNTPATGTNKTLIFAMTAL